MKIIKSERCDTYCKESRSRSTAVGELMTTAAWMRKFVREHEDYKGDSVVTESINYDLCKVFSYVGAGFDVIPELTGMLSLRVNACTPRT